MTRKQLEAAVAEGTSFIVRMADGREYPVPRPDFIWLPPRDATIAIVAEDDGTVHVLPLLTMTGITRPPRPNGGVTFPQ